MSFNYMENHLDLYSFIFHSHFYEHNCCVQWDILVWGRM